MAVDHAVDPRQGTAADERERRIDEQRLFRALHEQRAAVWVLATAYGTEQSHMLANRAIFRGGGLAHPAD